MKKIAIVLLSFFIFFASFLNAENNKILIDQVSESGMNFYWDTLSASGILEKNGHQISFRIDDPLLILDNTAITVTDAPSMVSNVIKVSDEFLKTAEQYFKESEDGNGFKIGAILIDPGHGGKDPGAAGTIKIDGKSVKVQEKDVVLNIGNMLCSKLKANYPDKQILMTRSTDKFLQLNERTEIANSVKLGPNEAIIYVSIHANASLDKKSSGYEVWYLSPGYRRTVLDKNTAEEDKSLFSILNSMMEEEYTTESILIAKFIMDGLETQIGKESKARGIKAEEWFVVRNSKMPSVLIEVGFVTNEKEAANLNSKAYLQRTATGIYNGISAFVTHFERSRGFTTKND